MTGDASPGEPVAPTLLDRVLAPYRPHCRYVLDATLRPPVGRRPAPDQPATHVVVEARCAIPASCYIDDTGHFNAVELNITYNQLLYTGIAAACHRGLLADLPWNLEQFFVHQLPDVLILEYRATFRRPLDPRAFTARFAIGEVLPKPHRDMVLLRTTCAARSAGGGQADAEVLVALVAVGAQDGAQDGRR